MASVATQNGATAIWQPERSPVLELVDRRLATGSRPGHRDPADSSKLALVIEGGGMRGVISAGMVTALDYLHTREAFDLIIGTSAGAMNGAWFLSGRPAYGTSLYYQDLIGKQWVDFRRALKLKPIIGLDYLMDTLMTEVKKLDCERVLGSGIPLYAVAATVPEYSVRVLSGFRSPQELRNALRASARIPIASGGPVHIGGDDLVDGSMASSIPAETAVESFGATHMLVLLTRPEGQLRGAPTRMSKLILQPVMNRLLRGLGDATGRRAARYAAELAYLKTLESSGDAGPHAFTIQLPLGVSAVRQLEQDPETLFAAASAGASAVYEALTGRAERFYPGLTLVP